MEDAVIVAAVRTPIGRLGGALAGCSAVELGAIALKAALDRSGISAGDIDDVIIGQVLQAGAGQNPARQAALAAKLGQAVPAVTVNQVCGGGQRALHMAAQSIRLGDAQAILVGGQDSMTRAPMVSDPARIQPKLGDVQMRDSMLVDGLIDAFSGEHMGHTAERLAQKYQIGREAQDEFALRSQKRAAAAVAERRFESEIIAVATGAARLDADETPRPETTLERLASLKPIFDPAGSITAGNASGLNDGAAALAVTSTRFAADRGLAVLARVASYASVGVDPALMGIGPVPASRKALKRAGWSLGDVDLAEVNEAFAAQALAVNQELGLDPDRVNVNGGAIALGHPLAGSGTRIIVTLLHEMTRTNVRKGLATMCIGGGQGVAVCLERDV